MKCRNYTYSTWWKQVTPNFARKPENDTKRRFCHITLASQARTTDRQHTMTIIAEFCKANCNVHLKNRCMLHSSEIRMINSKVQAVYFSHYLKRHWGVPWLAFCCSTLVPTSYHGRWWRTPHTLDEFPHQSQYGTAVFADCSSAPVHHNRLLAAQY